MQTEYYIMMIDGSCVRVIASDKVTAFCKASDRLEYESFDDFLTDINLCEWKDSENRIVESYSDGKTHTVRLPIDSPYELMDYSKLNLVA